MTMLQQSSSYRSSAFSGPWLKIKRSACYLVQQHSEVCEMSGLHLFPFITLSVLTLLHSPKVQRVQIHFLRLYRCAIKESVHRQTGPRIRLNWHFSFTSSIQMICKLPNKLVDQKLKLWLNQTLYKLLSDYKIGDGVQIFIIVTMTTEVL